MAGDNSFWNKTEKTAIDYERMNDYARLGISVTASVDEVKKAYRKMMLEYHPDRYKKTHPYMKIEDANRIAQYAQEAYDRISSGKAQAQSNTFHQNTDPAQERNTYSAEDIKKFQDRAIQQASMGAHAFRLFIEELKRKNVPGAEQFIDIQGVKSFVFQEAAKKLKLTVTSYAYYIKDWVDIGFHKSYIENNESFQNFLYQTAINKAKTGPVSFEQFKNDLKTNELLYILRSLEASRGKVYEVVRLAAATEADRGPVSYGIFVKNWVVAGIDKDVLNKDPEILKIVRDQVGRAKNSGKYAYESTVRAWLNEGIQVS